MTEPFPPTRRTVMAALASMVVAVGVLVPNETAHGIIDGQLDGNAHPYVAAVGPPSRLVASGVLISPTVVLTAAHVANRRLGPGAARVTFDSDAKSPSATWYTGTAYADPRYDPSAAANGDASDSYDLGVIVLDTPVVGITPARLPTEGLLDQLGPAGLSRSTFIGVGYGVSERSGPNGWEFTSGGLRRSAEQTFASLGSRFLRVRMSGSAEICSADSGGPTLLGSSNIVAGVTALEFSLAGGECRSMPWYQRVDTPEARAFLGQFVELP